MTDIKGRHASRGWVFFDRDCSVCTSLARRFRRPLESRGYGMAALQDPRVQALLALPPEDLLREMRVASAEGKIYGGAEAIVYLSSQIWWALPFFAAAKLPGIARILNAGYRWFADHRTCASATCAISREGRRTAPLRHPKGNFAERVGAHHGRRFFRHE